MRLHAVCRRLVCFSLLCKCARLSLSLCLFVCLCVCICLSCVCVCALISLRAFCIQKVCRQFNLKLFPCCWQNSSRLKRTKKKKGSIWDGLDSSTGQWAGEDRVSLGETAGKNIFLWSLSFSFRLSSPSPLSRVWQLVHRKGKHATLCWVVGLFLG